MSVLDLLCDAGSGWHARIIGAFGSLPRRSRVPPNFREGAVRVDGQSRVF
jgi:hypothetical protein